MSEVLDFFQKCPNKGYPLHRELAGIPDLKKRLRAVRQEMIVDFCRPVRAKGGGVALEIEDVAGYDALEREELGILDHLARIDQVVAALDALFAKAEAEGLRVPLKIPGGFQAAETQWRKTHMPKRFVPTSDTLTGRFEELQANSQKPKAPIIRNEVLLAYAAEAAKIWKASGLDGL
jgi:hypothetical protein